MITYGGIVCKSQIKKEAIFKFSIQIWLKGKILLLLLEKQVSYHFTPKFLLILVISFFYERIQFPFYSRSPRWEGVGSI